MHLGFLSAYWKCKSLTMIFQDHLAIPRNGIQRCSCIVIWAGQGVLHVPTCSYLFRHQFVNIHNQCICYGKSISMWVPVLADGTDGDDRGYQGILVFPYGLEGQYFLWNIFTWPIDTLRLRQTGHHFAVNIFKFIFLNENICILIKVSLEFVPKGVINKPALFQVMAWYWWGDNSLLEPTMTNTCVAI